MRNLRPMPLWAITPGFLFAREGVLADMSARLATSWEAVGMAANGGPWTHHGRLPSRWGASYIVT